MLRLIRPLSNFRSRHSTPVSPIRQLSSSLFRMSDGEPLATQKCVPCTSSLPPMPASEAESLLSTLPGKWSLSPQPKTLLSSKTTHPDALHRTYKFKNYLTAQAFANTVGELAEQEGHHPAVMVEWGRVTVWWWSHAINGLHKNDFVMAAKTEALVREAEGYTPPKPKA